MRRGNFGALQRLTPISEDFSGNIEKISQDVIGQNQNKKVQIDQANREKKARDLAITEKAAKDLEAFKPVITGVQSVDEINSRGLNLAVNRVGEIYRKFREDPNSLNDINLRIELSNLKRFPEILKNAEGRITQYAEDLAQGYGEGKYSKWDSDKLNELEAFFGVKGEDGRITPNYIIDFDPSGNLLARGLTKEGKYFEKSINDVVSGYEYSSITPFIDADEHTTNIAENLGKRITTSIGRGFITESQDFNSHESEIRKTIKESLGSFEEPSNLAKSVWSDERNLNRNRSEFNESSLSEIENYLVDQIASKYDESVKKRKLPNPPKPSKEKPSPGEGITLMTSTSGSPLKTSVTLDEGSDKDAYSFSLQSPINLGVGNKDKKINRIYLTDSGDIVFKGEERVVKVKKGSSGTGIDLNLILDPSNQESEDAFKEVDGGGLNVEEVNLLASRLGFNNAKELKDHLRGLTPSPSTTSGINWK